MQELREVHDYFVKKGRVGDQELKVVLSGQLVLIPVPELERWVQRHARLLVDPPVRHLRESSG